MEKLTKQQLIDYIDKIVAAGNDCVINMDIDITQNQIKWLEDNDILFVDYNAIKYGSKVHVKVINNQYRIIIEKLLKERK